MMDTRDNNTMVYAMTDAELRRAYNQTHNPTYAREQIRRILNRK